MASYENENGVKIVIQKKGDNTRIVCHKPLLGIPSLRVIYESETLHKLGGAHKMCAIKEYCHG